MPSNRNRTSLPRGSPIAPANSAGGGSVQPLVNRLLPQLARMLSGNFLSSSLGQPPGASPSATGNRTITLTNRSGITSAATPKQVETQPLAAGTLTWTYPTPFNNTPVIEYGAVGTPPTSGGIPAVLFIASVAANAVVISSTNNADTRTVHITATGNPN